MKEDFLHYLWKFKKFDSANLLTFTGEKVTILNSGQYLQLAGPDFFNAQLIIGNQKWAGNVEIHLKSSDWYLHHHETDLAYGNVILHVVWQHDAEIFRNDNKEIPVLELCHYVAKSTLEKYESLLLPKTWIFCERQLASVDEFIFKNWMERLFFERLERKSVLIEQILSETGNDWEAVLFCLLAKNFGLNTNGETFLKMARSIPFAVIRKEHHELTHLEAIFFGRAGLLEDEKEDVYFKQLKNNWQFLIHKHQLQEIYIDPVQFFKHRPDNFPTIRLAQLAQLYHKRQNLFSQVVISNNLPDFYELFKIGIPEYWQSHYQFDKPSPRKAHRLTNSFIDLLLINTIVPLQFAYAKSLGKDISLQLIQLMTSIAAEKNAILDKFNGLGIQTSEAFQSQSLIQLKNEYCNKSRCLECAIGIELLKTPTPERNLL